MKLINKLTIITLLLFAGIVNAADLTSVKASGVIGEQANGYIGFVKNASDEVKALVKEVNAKRKAKYKKIAISQKISLKKVENIAGNKAMKKTLSGNYIKPAGKGWVKRK
jgi:uncharacterized protein